MTEDEAKENLLAAIFAHDAALLDGDVEELAIADSFMESHRLVLEDVRETNR